MKKQRWKESEKRREEERRSDKRKSQKKEDASARKRRKVAQHLAPEGWKVGLLNWANERWKIACRCGAKQISKSKCAKHTNAGALLEVELSKKRAPLWRKAHSQVKMEHFWKLSCRKNTRRCGAKHTSKWNYTKHYGFRPLLEIQISLRHFASLHYTMLYYTTLHYTTLHYTTLHNTTTTTTQLDYTPLHSTTLNFTTPHCTALRSTTLHYIKLHYTPLHYITLHYAPQHYNYNYTTTLH